MTEHNPAAFMMAALLEERTGQKLASSRSWRIDSMLIDLFKEHSVNSLEEINTLLRRWPNPDLSNKVVEALINKETYFFRDRTMFDALTQQVMPQVAKDRSDRRRISILSAGCSTGQEAYSIAIAIAEAAGRWTDWTIDILGTDISEAAINTARDGIYTGFQVQRGLGVMQMLTWFDEVGPDRWQIKDALRKKVLFKVHNALEPLPSYRRFDIVMCRNVLLYFDQDRRKRIFENMANVMANDGWLMLGASESTSRQSDRFRSDTGISGFFRPISAPKI